MASLSSIRLKNVLILKAASIQRSTTRTPASTLALSRGFLTLAGMMAVP